MVPLLKTMVALAVVFVVGLAHSPRAAADPLAREAGAADAAPPEILAKAPKQPPVVLPDGSLKTAGRSAANAGPSGEPATGHAVSPWLLKTFSGRVGDRAGSYVSRDGGRTWEGPEPEFLLPKGAGGGGIPVLAPDGRIHVVFLVGRGEGRPADGRYIDLWHVRSDRDGKHWSRPRPIWEGYCGAVLDFKQLDSGRLVVPFAAWKTPGQIVKPNTGSNYSTVVYSDDQGETWHLAPVKLTSPCHDDFNGNNYGAIEPTILEMRAGPAPAAETRVWMLLRTQTGYLYESFSPAGANWSPAEPAPFWSSTSPASLVRTAEGRVALFWNNCEMPPRHRGQGVYGGRDALHAAVSADEGKTWHGFREVYRDPFRNDTPPRRGDRGTAYPTGVALPDGLIAVATGQGDRRTMVRVDPGWLDQTRQHDDFSDGLSAWHVWKPFGPAEHYWRDRSQGAVLINHPDQSDKKVLHVRRPDQRDPDGAVWNFPLGTRGTLTMRVMLPSEPATARRERSAGGTVALADRFFNPTDPTAREKTIAWFALSADEAEGDAIRLSPDRWHELSLDWDGAKRVCRAAVDGRPVAAKSFINVPLHGISYLRIRSTADRVDQQGLLVDSVAVEVEPPEKP